MKAKLVYCSFMTRVVVPDDATEDQVIEKAKDNLFEKVRNDLHENIEEVIDDEEVPYDPKHDK